MYKKEKVKKTHNEKAKRDNACKIRADEIENSKEKGSDIDATNSGEEIRMEGVCEEKDISATNTPKDVNNIKYHDATSSRSEVRKEEVCEDTKKDKSATNTSKDVNKKKRQR